MTGLDRNDRGWPVAGLDAIGRLRVIEAAVPAAAAAETVIDAPFDRVWAYVSDMERSIAEFDSLVSRVRIRRRRPRPAGRRTWSSRPGHRARRWRSCSTSGWRRACA